MSAFTASETVRSQRNWSANTTGLSGDIGTPGDNSDNSYYVILNELGSLTNAAKLDGFTITAGNANGGSSIDPVEVALTMPTVVYRCLLTALF